MRRYVLHFIRAATHGGYARRPGGGSKCTLDGCTNRLTQTITGPPLPPRPAAATHMPSTGGASRRF
ncbi:hypothetical protein BDY21DRAFT_336190 [Lineolata rhizophorae]|uniref:Uncharacterized protein n=1 Tax=Lineolata rhizophorae TaxID=578093 RepID=A0A6A6P9Q4_9PEZI|nr:hypothetical protein BDY21DRAFT_336190 [Lineolata rhizophorae]